MRVKSFITIGWETTEPYSRLLWKSDNNNPKNNNNNNNDNVGSAWRSVSAGGSTNIAVYFFGNFASLCTGLLTSLCHFQLPTSKTGKCFSQCPCLSGHSCYWACTVTIARFCWFLLMYRRRVTSTTSRVNAHIVAALSAGVHRWDRCACRPADTTTRAVSRRHGSCTVDSGSSHNSRHP